MRPLSLHHLTALRASPAQLVWHAAASGCGLVSFFTYMPGAVRHHYPLVEPSDAAALSATMVNAGVHCHCLEVFPLSSEADWAGMAAGLQTGAALGARLATVHIQEPDPAVAAEMLERLADLAGPHGIRLGIEFNPFSRCRTLSEAVALVERAPRAAAGIILDTLHAFRAGTAPADVVGSAAHVVGVQISDGPAEVAEDQRWREAIGARMLPGEGCIPLAEMIAPIDQRVVIDVEVPRHFADSSDVQLAQHCRNALSASGLFAGIV